MREQRASLKRMAFPLPDKPSIAVLAFDNLSGDPGQEYLSDGISEGIIRELSRFPPTPSAGIALRKCRKPRPFSSDISLPAGLVPRLTALSQSDSC